MGHGKLALPVAMVAVVANSAACAMSRPHTPPTCKVIGAERLPVGSGGAEALCNAIREPLSPGSVRSVVVEVGHNSMLGATVVLTDGREMEKIHIAVADRQLGPGDFTRLADAIARNVKVQ